MPGIHSDYLRKVYDHETLMELADRCITKTVEIMLLHPFEAIAFSGTSGAAMAYILSYRLGIPLICVRKKGDDGHHTRTFGGVRGLLEGHIDAATYLIVDDWISSGATVKRIAETIRQRSPNARCVGILLYQGSDWSNWQELAPGVDVPCFRIEHKDLGEYHSTL